MPFGHCSPTSSRPIASRRSRAASAGPRTRRCERPWSRHRRRRVRTKAPFSVTCACIRSTRRAARCCGRSRRRVSGGRWIWHRSSAASGIITVGKRLVPIEDIALVEAFEAREDSRLRSKKEFRARVVLVDRESLLIEQTQEAFAKANGFHWLAADQVALNPAIRFRVENFAPAEGFAPTKPYATRLRWHDGDNDQSKLLLARPEDVIALLAAPTRPAPLPPRGSAGSSKLRRARRNARTSTPPAQPKLQLNINDLRDNRSAKAFSVR